MRLRWTRRHWNRFALGTVSFLALYAAAAWIIAIHVLSGASLEFFTQWTFILGLVCAPSHAVALVNRLPGWSARAAISLSIATAVLVIYWEVTIARFVNLLEPSGLKGTLFWLTLAVFAPLAWAPAVPYMADVLWRAITNRD